MALNQIFRNSHCLFLCVFFLFGVDAQAGILPTWDPGKLTRRSDLVVVGRLSASEILIADVLKGHTNEHRISVGNLNEFSNTGTKVDPDGDVIIFLSQRTHPPRVVANGIYRMGKAGTESGVLGYWQRNNPGGYTLSSEIQFKDLSVIKALVQAELDLISALQKEFIGKVKLAKTNREYCVALNDLENITRIGDVHVLKQVATLDIDGTRRRVHDVFRFVQIVNDPKGATLLHALYDKHGDTSILHALGTLGNPESLEYFDLLIKEKHVPDPLYALYGMKALYLSLEAKGDRKTCKMIRDSIYGHVDQNLPSLMMSAPALISVIPDQGSLNRLQQAYEYHAKRRSNAEFEIERHIERCKEKILRFNKDDLSG